MKSLINGALAFFAGLFLLISCSSSSPLNQVNVTAEGIAIKGYDPVAYFTVGQPVKGNKEFSHKWNSATWLWLRSLAMPKTGPTMRKLAPVTPATMMPKQAEGDSSAALMGRSRGA